MDSGVIQSRVHESDQNHAHHNVELKQGKHYGVEEQHHDPEKKSVLNKVKAKAKKIKDTIKKHTHHDHDHDHEHLDIPDDHDLDEEDDEEEEVEENPEVHGAPIYESTAARSMIPGDQVDHHHHREPKVVVVSTGIGTDQTVGNDHSATRTFHGEEGKAGQGKFNLQKPIADLEEDPAAPRTTPKFHTASNYQSKVTDPTGAGGAEMQVSPVLKSFGEMNNHEGTKPHPQPHVRSTATQDPSGGAPILYDEQKHCESMNKPSIQKPIVDLEEDPAAPGTARQPHTASNYQSKVTDPTGAGGAELQVSPVLRSFGEMNIHEGTKPHPQPHVHSAATQHPSGGAPILYEEQKHYDSMDKPSIQSSYTETQSPSGTPIVYEEHKLYESKDKPSIQSSYTTTQSPSGTPILHEEHKLYESMDTPSNQTSYTANQYPSGTPEMHVDERSYGSLDKPSNQTSYTANQYPSGTSEMHVDERSYGSLENPSNQSSYTDKISSATSAIADKAVTAKNAVASKLGYDDNKSHRAHENEQSHEENQRSYTDKISSATSAVADKAIAAKNAVTSKLGYGDNEVGRDNEKERSHGENQSGYISSATSAIADKAVSAKNVVTSKLGYGENRVDRENEKEISHGENQNQSGYTEKLSSATSAIADKAVSAKNAVTSKLGYGSGGGENERTTHEEHPKTENSNASTAEYGKRITESLTQKLAPVYGKVSGVGSAVKSKLSPSSTNEADKGVSVRDYFAEKLKPGEEDMALSEVISEALHKRGGEKMVNESGGEHEGRKMTDVVSDVIHERDEGLAEKEHRPMGKVTESEEVKRRLGGESYESNSSGKGVVDRIKDAAGSWFGTSQEKNPSSQDTGERRLQESSN